MYPWHEILSLNPLNLRQTKKSWSSLAGQWPRNSASLLLMKTEAQKEKISYPKPDVKAKHRGLVTFKGLEDEAKKVYIYIDSTVKPKTQPMNLLLAENLMPVDEKQEMPEWDNVLVPVVPMYFNSAEKSEQVAARHMSGYIYVLWQQKVWRELEITDKGYFADVNIEYYRAAEQQSTIPKCHADICITAPETGSPFSYEPYQIVQNGQVVCEGMLNDVGEARVFNLTEEEVDVVMTDYDPQVVVTVATKLSPFKGANSKLREASGRPMPHIWLPYKILGEVQSVFVYYSANQLSNQQLSALESDPSQATEITDWDNYSNAQSFKTKQGVTRA